jgi:hypothetical protein
MSVISQDANDGSSMLLSTIENKGTDRIYVNDESSCTVLSELC